MLRTAGTRDLLGSIASLLATAVPESVPGCACGGFCVNGACCGFCAVSSVGAVVGALLQPTISAATSTMSSNRDIFILFTKSLPGPIPPSPRHNALAIPYPVSQNQ